MKYVVFFVACGIAGGTLGFVGIDVLTWQYWAISMSFQFAGYCIARIAK